MQTSPGDGWVRLDGPATSAAANPALTPWSAADGSSAAGAAMPRPGPAPCARTPGKPPPGHRRRDSPGAAPARAAAPAGYRLRRGLAVPGAGRRGRRMRRHRRLAGTDRTRPRGGGGSFRRLAYRELDAASGLGRFDALVCNFSLLDEDLAGCLAAWPALLESGGELLIQTLHPWAAGGDYRDGWREELRRLRRRLPRQHALVFPHPGVLAGAARRQRLAPAGSERNRPSPARQAAVPVAAGRTRRVKPFSPQWALQSAYAFGPVALSRA